MLHKLKWPEEAQDTIDAVLRQQRRDLGICNDPETTCGLSIERAHAFSKEYASLADQIHRVATSVPKKAMKKKSTMLKCCHRRSRVRDEWDLMCNHTCHMLMQGGTWHVGVAGWMKISDCFSSCAYATRVLTSDFCASAIRVLTCSNQIVVVVFLQSEFWHVANW